MQGEARDMTAYGAAAGKGNSRTAIQGAIDECAARGGGVVRIPAGRFTSGTLGLKTGVALWLDHGAALAVSNDPAHYEARRPTDRLPRDAWVCAFMLPERVERVAILGHVAITGGGLAKPTAYDGDRLEPSNCTLPTHRSALKIGIDTYAANRSAGCSGSCRPMGSTRGTPEVSNCVASVFPASRPTVDRRWWPTM